MKFCKRLFSVLLCWAFLFIAFSPSANADEINTNMTYVVNWKSYFTRGSTTTERNVITTRFIPNDGDEETEPEQITSITSAASSYTWYQNYTFSDLNSGILAKKGLKHTVRLNDIYFSAYVDYPDGIQDSYSRNPDSGRILIQYNDSTFLYIDDIDITASDGSPFVNVVFSFTPEKDVKSIELQLSKEINPQGTANVTRYPGEYGGDVRHDIIIDQSTEEAGLLDGILGFLKTIKDTVLNLPSLIWEKISSGLQALFIPSEEYITTFKDDIDSLLSSRLGAVYEVVNITLNSWERIGEYDEKNTIHFPKTCIPLPEGCTFEFGGQDVKIVPDGFETLVTAVKLAVGVVCTGLFVNGLKKRYDDTMKG